MITYDLCNISGSDSGIVKVWDVNDQEAPVSRFRNSNGGRNTYTRGEPIHPVISMEFHPHMMMLAVCSDNAKINVRLLHYVYTRTMPLTLYDIPLGLQLEQSMILLLEHADLCRCFSFLKYFP